MSSKLEKLLIAKKKRQRLEDRIMAALHLRYQIVDKEKAVSRESATAGHVYSYLALVLKVPDSSKFRGKIKEILIANGTVKPVSSSGFLWFKGLAGLKEDEETAQGVIEQHYKDRERYRTKQREFAFRRYQELPKPSSD